MSIPTGTVFSFPVQFFGDSGLPIQTDDCLIFVQNPANVVTSAAGAYDADTDSFMRNVTTTAGIWYWWGTTTDPDATAAKSATGMIVVVTASATGGAPSLEEIVAALSGVKITVISPVLQAGRVTEIIRGDDYFVADGRGIIFILEDEDGGEPIYDMVGATAVFEVDGVEYGMTVDGYTLTLELTSAETTAMAFNTQPYSIKVTLDNGHEITPVCGRMKVKECA